MIGREQRRSRDAALRLSAVDPLTGLFNRSFFFAALEREMARSARSGRGFCLLMLDLDELKAINDRSGHHAGDAVLRAVSDTIRGGIRRIDVAARYGGDEFVGAASRDRSDRRLGPRREDPAGRRRRARSPASPFARPSRSASSRIRATAPRPTP